MWFLTAVVVFISVLFLFLYLNKDIYRMRRLISNMPRVNCLPIIGSVLEFPTNREELFQSLIGVAKDHGPVVAIWFGSELVVMLSSVEDIKVILSSNRLIKKSRSYDFFDPWLGKSLLISSGKEWQRKRKMITPSFHFKILENFIEVFNSNSSVLIEKLKNEVGKISFDVTKYINLFTLDVISEAAMGVKVNAQKDEQSPFIEAIHQLATAIVHRSFKPWLYPDFMFSLSPTGRRFYKHLKIVQNFVQEIINSKRLLRQENVEKKSSTETSEDYDVIGIKKRPVFLDLLLDLEDEEGGLLDNEIREEVNTFMFAGHDTTTAAISFSLYSVMKFQNVQVEVMNELEEIFGDSKRVPTYTDLSNMKYLERVIKETLRIWPPVPLIEREMTEDVNLPSGYILPKGSTALLNIYSLHNSQEVYLAPGKFNPDRFMVENLEGQNPYAFCPFSAGPRNCIGQKFATLEIKTVLSSILRNFKILPPFKEHPDINLTADLILRSSTGINIRLENR